MMAMNILTYTFATSSFNISLSALCFGLFFMINGTFTEDKIEISGTIFEAANQEPLSGALILVTSSKSPKGISADYNGNFKLLLDKGEHTLLISFLGYESKEMTIHTSQPNLGNIVLAISDNTLKEIVISTSQKRYHNDFKGSNFRINPIVLKNTNPLNTEELLRTVPGVNIVGDMGLSNRPNISIGGSWGRRSQKILDRKS